MNGGIFPIKFKNELAISNRITPTHYFIPFRVKHRVEFKDVSNSACLRAALKLTV